MSTRRRLSVAGQVHGQRRRRDADCVRNPDMGQVATLAEPIRNRSANAQPRGDLLHREKRLHWQLKAGRLLGGDTGATNLASQVVAPCGLSMLERRPTFRISRACDARNSRLTRGKPHDSSSGPGGRRFKSCLPDQSSRRNREGFSEREFEGLTPGRFLPDANDAIGCARL
jgi:hypothetical protein